MAERRARPQWRRGTARRSRPNYRCGPRPHRAGWVAAAVAGRDRRRSRAADPARLPQFPIEAGDPLRVSAAGRRDGPRRAAAGRGRRAAAGPAVRSADAAIRRTAAVQTRPRSAAPRIAARSGGGALRRRLVAALDAMDAGSGRYRHRRDARRPCGQVDRGRLCGGDAGLAARRCAGSRADDGGARCAAAPDRTMARAEPAIRRDGETAPA